MQAPLARRDTSVPTPRRQPRVSVVIITRNRAPELDRTLAEISRDDPTPPVVVVDNASADHTATVIGRHSSALPSVRHLRLSQNLGAVGRNFGVMATDTPYVAFCDDDSWWQPGSLTIAADILDKYPHVGGVIARTLVNAPSAPDPINEILDSSPLAGPSYRPGPRILGFLACAAVIRTDAFTQVGGFSPLLGIVGEESLLAMDLAAKRWPLCYVESMVVHHHPSQRRSAPSERRGRELSNALLTDVMRRPALRGLRSATRLSSALLRGEVGTTHLWSTMRRMPHALLSRRTLPKAVELDLLLVEANSA